MKKKQNKNDNFTLSEILVVLVLAGIILLIAFYINIFHGFNKLTY